VQRSRSLAKKYAAYALAGATLGVPAVDAAVMSVDPPDTIQSSPSVISYDINGDTVNDYQLSLYTGFTMVPFAGVQWNTLASNAVAEGAGGFPAALQGGATVGPALTYGDGGILLEKKFATYTIGNWPNNLSDPRFVGLQFQIGTNTHYGWARIGVDANSFIPVSHAIVYDWAFEDTPDTPASIMGSAT
jgi:hypothetical protein